MLVRVVAESRSVVVGGDVRVVVSGDAMMGEVVIGGDGVVEVVGKGDVGGGMVVGAKNNNNNKGGWATRAEKRE